MPTRSVEGLKRRRTPGIIPARFIPVLCAPPPPSSPLPPCAPGLPSFHAFPPDDISNLSNLTSQRLSKKYHPDINPDSAAHEKFIEVSKAYEVLTDDEKRRIYDRHGEKGLEQHEAQKQGGGNPFAQFFGGGMFVSLFGTG